MTIQEQLAAMKEGGLTFADCVRAFYEPEEQPTIDEARTMYGSDQLEVDDEAIVSRSEGGAFVSAWVFVGRDEDEDEDEAAK